MISASINAVPLISVTDVLASAIVTLVLLGIVTACLGAGRAAAGLIAGCFGRRREDGDAGSLGADKPRIGTPQLHWFGKKTISPGQAWKSPTETIIITHVSRDGWVDFMEIDADPEIARSKRLFITNRVPVVTWTEIVARRGLVKL